MVVEGDISSAILTQTSPLGKRIYYGFQFIFQRLSGSLLFKALKLVFEFKMESTGPTSAAV